MRSRSLRVTVAPEMSSENHFLSCLWETFSRDMNYRYQSQANLMTSNYHKPRKGRSSRKRITMWRKKMTSIEKYDLYLSLSLSLSYVRVCTRTSLSRTVSVDVRARGCQESQEETSEKRASEQPKQLCTSRLGSGLHLYPRVCHSRRAQGADAPIRAYNLPPRSLSLARSLDRARILLQPSTRRARPPVSLKSSARGPRAVHAWWILRLCSRACERLRSRVCTCASSRSASRWRLRCR